MQRLGLLARRRELDLARPRRRRRARARARAGGRRAAAGRPPRSGRRRRRAAPPRSPARARHLALVVDHDRVAVEDQLVLPADRVAERDEARVVARADAQHLLALAVLADVERRRRDVRDQLRAGEREVGRRRPGLPDVLADRRPDEHLAEAEQEQVAAGREVAVLVEDAVVRQEALAVDARGSRRARGRSRRCRGRCRGAARRRARSMPCVAFAISSTARRAARMKPGRSRRSSGG